MTVDYCGNAHYYESDDMSTLNVPVDKPHSRYLKVTDTEGNIHLFNLEHLDPAERAVYEDEGFLASTIRGLGDIAGDKVSELDWVFDDE